MQKHTLSQKWGTFIFAMTSAKLARFHNFSMLNSEKNLREKIELKLSPPLKSVAAVPCESKWSTIRLYSTANSVQTFKVMINVSLM